MELEVFTNLKEKIHPAHTAIVVVDMQNDSCAAKGVLDQEGYNRGPVQDMIPRLKDFLERARKLGVRVIFLRAIKREEDITPPVKELMRRLGRANVAGMLGTWGAEFVEGIGPRQGELVVDKVKYSGFVGTDLDAKLRELGIRTLIMTGIATNVCVESTAREAFMRDYYVVFTSDLSAAPDPVLHQATLTTMETHFAQVVSAEELIQEWEAISSSPSPSAPGRSSGGL